MPYTGARATQQGFSLLEVLVTLVLLTVGMLGVVGLVLHARQANEQALANTRATLLVEDLLERMRANTTAAALEVYGASTSVVPTQINKPERDCRATECSPAEMARFDLYDWAQQISMRSEPGPPRDGLLDAQGCIDISPVNPAPGSIASATVILAWRGSGASRATGPNGQPISCGSDDIPAARQFVMLSTRYLVDS
ncbi:type IV pilus modification protein PilV [Kushneria phosphatilytica]|nr:type IV pilus modification protein PilV [Kushneria phosphatilytica]OHV11492.1 type IV pilus modification protein PilV [Kushneria phosphatilytica]